MIPHISLSNMSDVFPGSCHIVISEGNTLLKDQPTIAKDKYKQNSINLVNVMPEEARKAVHVYTLQFVFRLRQVFVGLFLMM